jgi:hypothetical protein
MKMKTSRALILLTAFLLLASCATVGVARLPDTDKSFITTASDNSFVMKRDLVIPYQPLGLVEYSVPQLRPFQSDHVGLYRSLEMAINQHLVKIAREKLGADAVVDVKFEVRSSFKDSLPVLDKIPVAGWVGMFFTGLFNVNTVRVTGLAVKMKAGSSN